MRYIRFLEKIPYFYLFLNPLKIGFFVLNRWIFTLGVRRSVHFRQVPLQNFDFIDVVPCEFIIKTTGTQGSCPS